MVEEGDDHQDQAVRTQPASIRVVQATFTKEGFDDL